MFLRVCGDVHGCINTPHPRKNISYLDIIRGADYSVQLGDMGFNYIGLTDVDANHHVFLPGNHDNYDALPEHALHDYGLCTMGVWQYFYVRGAWSIDIRQRLAEMETTGCAPIWWPQEELSRDEMEACLECYSFCKPRVVMTHSCPASISEQVGSPNVWKLFGWNGPRTSNTQQLLQAMYEVHQPELWLFGHFHKNWMHVEALNDTPTSFICVNILDYVDFNADWEML